MFKFGGNHLAGGLSRVVAANASLDISFQLIQGDLHAFPVRFPDSLVGPDQGSDRNTLRSAKSGVPAGTVLGGLHPLSLLVLVFGCDSMLHKLLGRGRVLPFGQSIELLARYRSRHAPLAG